MAVKPISQREARALKRRVKQLEQRVNDVERAERLLRRTMGFSSPGTHIRTMEGLSAESLTAMRTANRLGYVVIAKAQANGSAVELYAVPTETPANV